MLHLRALEEAHSAVHAIRYGRIEQRVLQHPRLGIRAVKHGDLGQRESLVGQTLGDVNHECCLVVIRRRRHPAHRVALPFAGPQVLAEPGCVVLDERVGNVENVTVRSVVLLQLYQLHGIFR